MNPSRMLVSLFLLLILLLTACQSGATPTPEAAAPATTPPKATSTQPPPTAAPTETPAEVSLEPGQCVQLIENGGFETGALEPWTLNSNLGKDGIANFRPGSGQYSVVLGDGLNADERLEVEVAIPASAATATLSFWADYMSQETDNQSHDVLNVSVQTSDGQIFGLFKLDNTSPKVDPHRVFDMTEYIGKSLTLFFHAQTDAQNRSDFSIDDVTVEACGPQPAAAAPTQTLPVAAAPTAAAVPTTATLGQGQCVELIQNGDFETGSPPPWFENSSANKRLLIEFPGARGKFSGSMGGGSGLEESLEQDVQIPAGAASVTLTYWWMHGGRETDGQPHDFMRVRLYDPTGAELALIEEISNATPPDREFAQSTRDLTEYMGQRLRLAFKVTTDAQNDSDFFVDDVSIQACGPK